MRISGLQNTSICSQTKMSLGVSVTLDDIFSDFSFGLLGDNNLSIEYKSSKFLQGDKFISASNATNQFSATISQDPSGRLIYINGVPVDYTSGNFGKVSGFYLSGDASVEYSILGVAPNLELEDVDSVVSLDPAEFKLVNSSIDVDCKIYNVNILNSNVSDLSVYGFTSGQSLSSGVPIFMTAPSGTLVRSGYAEIEVLGDFGSRVFYKDILVNTLENPILFNVEPIVDDVYLSEGEYIDFTMEGFTALPSDVQSILTIPSGDVSSSWKLYSGLNPSTMFDYKSSGKYDGNKYEDNPIELPYESSIFHRVRVEYLGGSPDDASLVISIGSQSKNITIKPNV